MSTSVDNRRFKTGKYLRNLFFLRKEIYIYFTYIYYTLPIQVQTELQQAYDDHNLIVRIYASAFI